MKCVMIVDSTLSGGVLANLTAALGLSLGNHVSGLIGPDVMDASGGVHKGITAVPIPILTVDAAELSALYHKAKEMDDGMVAIGFSCIARNCHDYGEYAMQMAAQIPANYMGICLHGPKKSINRLCGQLRLYR